MSDILKIILGAELIFAVLAVLGGGPFGWEDAVIVFVGINVVAVVLLAAYFLITSGVS